MITEADVATLSKTFVTKTEFHQEISNIRGDIVEIRNDISDMKGDITVLKHDVAEIRSDVSDMKEMIQGLIISVDGFTKSMSEVKVEQAAMGMQLTRHEKWHHKTAGKLNMKLEY
jgi:soluble cytochrome b562